MADIRTKYGTEAALTITLASLADDNTNTIAGRASTAVVNSGNEIDMVVSGKMRTGTSPVSGRTIEIWAYAQIDDTPTYPDSVTGTDAAKTFTSANVLQSSMRFVATITTDSTTGRDYFIPPTSIASVFGGVLPKRWGIFILNRTGVALDSTGGNHKIVYLPIQYQTV